MTRRFTFAVEDRPAPQGSKRHVGNGRMIESSKYVATWREAVKAAALARRASQGIPAGYYYPDGPVLLRIDFWHRRPGYHYRTGKHGTELKPGVPTFVDKRPDLSKLIRSTEDAITAAGIWRDDAQVAEVRCRQLYSDTGYEGAEITIADTEGEA